MIYHLNLKGDARTSGERRKQECGNIFHDQIKVGVGITVLVRTGKELSKKAVVRIYDVDNYLSSENEVPTSDGLRVVRWRVVV
jgi:predicted helicase